MGVGEARVAKGIFGLEYISSWGMVVTGVGGGWVHSPPLLPCPPLGGS